MLEYNGLIKFIGSFKMSSNNKLFDGRRNSATHSISMSHQSKSDIGLESLQEGIQRNKIQQNLVQQNKTEQNQTQQNRLNFSGSNFQNHSQTDNISQTSTTTSQNMSNRILLQTINLCQKMMKKQSQDFQMLLKIQKEQYELTQNISKRQTQNTSALIDLLRQLLNQQMENQRKNNSKTQERKPESNQKLKPKQMQRQVQRSILNSNYKISVDKYKKSQFIKGFSLSQIEHNDKKTNNSNTNLIIKKEGRKNIYKDKNYQYLYNFVKSLQNLQKINGGKKVLLQIYQHFRNTKDDIQLSKIVNSALLALVAIFVKDINYYCWVTQNLHATIIEYFEQLKQNKNYQLEQNKKKMITQLEYFKNHLTIAELCFQLLEKLSQGSVFQISKNAKNQICQIFLAILFGQHSKIYQNNLPQGIIQLWINQKRTEKLIKEHVNQFKIISQQQRQNIQKLKKTLQKQLLLFRFRQKQMNKHKKFQSATSIKQHIPQLIK